jgi:hypothetical protein
VNNSDRKTRNFFFVLVVCGENRRKGNMRDEYGIQPDGMHAICQSTSQDKINYTHVSRSVELGAGIFFFKAEL